MSVEELRDWVIVIYGIAGIVFFFVGLIVLLVVGFSLKKLISTVRGLLDESVAPTLSSVREAADTVRGTTEFVGRTAVAPVAKVYGTFAGVKRGLNVLSSMKGRGKSG